MYESSEKTWNCAELKSMIDEERFDFNKKAQRGIVWTAAKKNLLIDSLLRGIPIRPVVVTKEKNNIFGVLDGKQRLTTIYSYMNDEFALKDLKTLTYEEGKKKIDLDLNKKKFSDLPEKLQEKIKSRSIKADYYEALTEEEEIELFFRINNGKSLSNLEQSWAKAKSGECIIKLADHELFSEALSKADKEKSLDKDTVIKSYAVLYKKDVSFDSKFMNSIIQETEFTEEQIEEMNKIYDRILNILQEVIAKRITRRICKRTHLISIVPTIKKSLEEERTEEEMKEFLEDFFGSKETTKSKKYNESAAGSGTGKRDKVKARVDEVLKYYKKFFSKKKSENETEVSSEQ